ncbi:acyl transferase [Halpernia sp.]|uniref:LuxE/PaaK family acyltransferase n=1 Tax=Halpernia sp. TaxID=2782209 RepID=UPI003A9389D1
MLKNIFNIKTDLEFQQKCLETFQYQYKNVEVYKKFVDFLNIDISKIDKVEKIPFLPIEMFKNHQILDKSKTSDLYFQSSGTSLQTRSKHWIADTNLYRESISKSFEQFIGKTKDYIFLGLLPNYSENEHSSLIYMVDFLMKKSEKAENNYFLYNHLELYILLEKLARENKKVILFGVSFALLDFLDSLKLNQLILKENSNFIVIETGGMKGRKEEITKDELLRILQNGFKTEKIYSEYSMTELLSQAYSLGNNIYDCPSWMRILVRNTEDPLSYEFLGKTGALNIIDLANLHTCSFIATQDLGKIIHGNQFQVLGRIDHSDIRGCSLLVS